MQPSPEQIKAFLAVFDKLTTFEVGIRHTRGYGAFTQEEIGSFPIPGVKKVRDWLEELAKASSTVQEDREFNKVANEALGSLRYRNVGKPVSLVEQQLFPDAEGRN